MLLNKLLLPPNKAQITAIKAELSENTDRFENNVKLLEQWLDCKSYLPKNYDKNILGAYLRGCKHNMEVAKKKLEMLFVAITKMPELFSVREYTENEKRVVENMAVALLPKLTPEGFRVSVSSLITSNIDFYEFNTLIKQMCKVAQFRACKDTMSAGDIFIVDLANITFSHITKTSIPLLEKGLFLYNNCCHLRIKGIYFINAPGYAHKLINVFKFLLPAKIQNRVIVDKGISTLKNIPKESLPKDYGGSELSLNELKNLWDQCFEENKEWFANWETVQLIGPVPKSGPADILDNFSTHGSFRQLNLD